MKEQVQAALGSLRQDLEDAIAARLVQTQTFRPAGRSLQQRIRALAPQMAQAAQEVLDEWDQNEDGEDEMLGSGGACDRVAEALADVIGRNLSDVTFTEGGQPGDDHAFYMVYNDAEACSVDIPPYVYESGGGYSWKKKPDVQIRPDHIEVATVPRSWIEESE